MDKIISDFGIQPIYLLAQSINFIILLLILRKFLYRPVLKVLEARKKTVSDSLINAEQISNKLLATDQESARKLSEATKHARLILEKASNSADQIIAGGRKKAHADVKLIIEQGKESILVEREMMKKEMTNELESLVILGVERIAGKVLEHPDHSKIVNQTIEELKKNISSKAL